MPFFSPVGWIGADGLLSQRGFDVGAVSGLPFPGNSLQIVIFGQAAPPQGLKESGPFPLLEFGVQGGRAKAVEFFPGKGIPLNTSTEDIHNG